MSYKFITQLIIIILSGAVIVTYISPSFQELKNVQTEVDKFKEAVAKASQFNMKLQEHLSKMNSVSKADLQKLDEYLPATVDTIAVAQDLESIALRSGMSPSSISLTVSEKPSDSDVQYIQTTSYLPTANSYDEYGNPMDGVSVPAPDLTKQLETYEFGLTLSGSYDDFLFFLDNIERNNYPLRVTDLAIKAGESGSSEGGGSVSTGSGNYSFDLTIETFAFPSNN